MNALAAAAVTSALGIDLDSIIAGLGAFEGVSGRLANCYTASGARIINDTYNANPQSLKAAMQVLADSGGDSWLVLGDMAELGDEQVELHRKVGEQARSLGVKHLLATGDLARVPRQRLMKDDGAPKSTLAADASSTGTPADV